MLATLRDAEADWGPAVGDALGDLARVDPLRLPLVGLTTEEVGTYLRGRSDADVPDDVARALRDRTEGNPFYIGHSSTCWLARTGSVRRPRWTSSRCRTVCVTSCGVGSPSCPTTPGRCWRRLPSWAARSTPTSSRAPATWTNPLAVEEGLEVALSSGLVIEEPSGSYRFAHALVQEAVYAGIPGPRRARRHAAVAHTLAALLPGAASTRAAEIAEHHARREPSRPPQLGVGGTGGGAGAPGRCARGGRPLARDRCCRRRPRPDRHRRRTARLVVAHVSALIRAGQVAEAWERAVVRAGEVLDEGDAVASAELAVSVTTTVWNWRPYGSVDSRAVALLERLRHELPEERPVLRARVIATLALELFWVDAPRSRELTAAALDLVPTDALDRPELPEASEVSEVLEVAHASLMHVDRARDRLDVAERLLGQARARGDRELEARALLMRGSDRAALGHFADGWSDYADARELATAQGQPIVDVIVRYAEVLRPLAEGRAGDAEEMLAEVVALQPAYDDRVGGRAASLFQLTIDLVHGDRSGGHVPSGWLLTCRPGRGSSCAPWCSSAPAGLTRCQPSSGLGRPATRGRRLPVALHHRPPRRGLVTRLGDPVAVAELRDQLLPFRGLPVWVGTGVGFAGFTDHYLGLLARSQGDLDAAVVDLEAARDGPRGRAWRRSRC